MATRDFARTFGMPADNSASASAARQELPKADVWMNIGYTVDIIAEDGTPDTRFVSLPVGIALDTQKPIDIKTRSADLADLQANQNALLTDLQKYAEGLAPGEETLINLQIQLRRVKDPVVAPTATQDSVFARKIDFGMEMPPVETPKAGK